MQLTKRAWEIYAAMDGERLVGIYAKDPNRPSVIDITEDLARLIAVQKPNADAGLEAKHKMTEASHD